MYKNLNIIYYYLLLGRTKRNECEREKERMEVSEKGGRRMAKEEKAN